MIDNDCEARAMNNGNLDYVCIIRESTHPDASL